MPNPNVRCTPLLAPHDGVPDVVVDERRLVEAGRAIAGGTGPVAVDAERASGHRYGQKAYLVQLRRAGSGTWLIDPMACPDLGPVAEGIGDAEWVLHAATQDLPCLAQVGLRPTKLFDTELGRPAGRAPPRRARRGGRALPRAVPGQGALGRRLVDPAAARTLAPVCRARRRGARRAARRDRRGPRGPEQDGVGRGGVRRPARLRRPTGPRRPLAPHVRDAPDPQAPRPRHRQGAVDSPATGSRNGATPPPAGSCRTASSSSSRTSLPRRSRS